MEFEELKQKVVKRALQYGEENNIDIDLEYSVLKLVEELGEYTQALLIHQKKSRPSKHLDHNESHEQLAKELADLVGLAILNAHFLGVDLEKAIEEKWFSKLT